jgi:glucose/arabinose dehydrogenase
VPEETARLRTNQEQAMQRLITMITLFCLSNLCLALDSPFEAKEIARFNEPWAMTFMPDGDMLITEKRGRLYVVTQDGVKSRPVEDVPNVDYRGQGGLGDVILHPDFANNNIIYLSYAESGVGNVRGAAVMRGRLDITKRGPFLRDGRVIWRQNPKVTDDGHYAHRMLFDSKGYLFITSGERQKFTPAQQMNGNLGKIVRLHEDGSIPEGNPFFEDGDVTAEIWSLGHRNPLGLAIDAEGRLWNHEMGPLHGDEMNLIIKGENYGYPIVSEGDHYSGEEIPDHDTHPEFKAPDIAWVPTVAPSGMIFYSGNVFPQFKGNALIGGLASRAIIQVAVDGEKATEVARFDMGNRIREVEQGPGGAIWVLEDSDGGRLLKLTPVN